MDYIKIKNQTIFLDNRIQSGSKAEPFRLSAIEKDLQKPSKWINKTECWCWKVTFRYIENLTTGFVVSIDYNDNFINIEKI